MTRPEAEPGVLLVDKPEGPTSHDVVAAVRRVLRTRRVGHTGTLDPFATGLLLLCVGRATRLASLFHLLPKRYEAGIVLGLETDTDDRTGAPGQESEAWRELARADAERALGGLTGDLLQTPPAFSAKKVGGRRAHRLAREGEPPGLAPSPVRVHRIEVVEWAPPRIRVDAWVSTGTYVRALARDLGRELGCGAHLGDLRRTAVGPFEVGDALSADGLAGEAEVRESAAWLAPLRAVDWLPLRALGAGESGVVSHGGAVPEGDVRTPRRHGFPVGPEPPVPVALADGDALVALAERRDGWLRPRTVIRAA